MKHTPGPWTLEAGRNIVTQSGEFYITYGQDRYKNPKFKDFCELDANAHLIAAAPELLESLRTLAETSSNMLDAFQQYRPGAGYAVQQDLNRAVALLTKLA